MVCYIETYFSKNVNGKIVYDWNVTEFCKFVGISRTYFYQIVKSEKIPTLAVAYKICDYINSFLNDSNVWTVEDLWRSQ